MQAPALPTCSLDPLGLLLGCLEHLRWGLGPSKAGHQCLQIIITITALSITIIGGVVGAVILRRCGRLCVHLVLCFGKMLHRQ